ncbi:myrosinase 1-like isoform X2 [Athalia rosae]|uniref:myrosinase 1-like isoform X2 n=1 Tax=Athalia rosae TaxID=37344 RepID=UPI002033883F|nr:myrosinase 1-like isoform X2 [Athalia rosae]
MFQLDYYRFSISWSRILPTGYTNQINKDGIQYYKNLINELLENGIEPIVTLYHWDHPQFLEEMGGWTNEIIVDLFVDYARIMFKALGDKVQRWVTINEPTLICRYGYYVNSLQIAPGKDLGDVGVYLCGHNILKAHAKTYHMYDKEFRATQNGQLSIALQCMGYVAADGNDVDTAFQFDCGWMAHPIYKGDYPEIMKSRVALVSKAQGYSRSRLPRFSKKWISYIKGTWDYFAFNHYTPVYVTRDPDERKGIYNSDTGLINGILPSWEASAGIGFYVLPSAFGDLLRKLKDEYDNPPVWITENGCPDHGEIEDYNRIRYHYLYLTELLKAVKRDGCNVKAYTIWSIIDLFEWNSGFTVKFGIVSVDFDDPSTPRSPKLSTYWWKNVIKSRKLLPIPTNSSMMLKKEFSSCHARSGPFS